MKAVIIEDEAAAAGALRALIGEVCPDIEVVAELQAIDESVEWFAANPMPDVAFMDIHLADGSSFTIFDETAVTCPVIFTTAYDEYALKAFEVNSIDYLLKPIAARDLERAVGKLRGRADRPDDRMADVERLLASMRQARPAWKQWFLVPERDKLIPLAAADIACIRIDAKIVRALTHGGKSWHLDQTLDELAQQLDPAHFFRANRQWIISREAVSDLSQWFGGKLSVNLKIATSERILVSKARVGEFKKWFAGS